MTIKYSRAQRRADYARIKEKRQFHWGYGKKQNWNVFDRGTIQNMSAKQAGIVASTATPCSCWMCGNPRRGAAASHDHGNLTLQECKAQDDHEAQLDEYFLEDDYCYHDYEWETWWFNEDYEWAMWAYVQAIRSICPNMR